MPQDELPDPQEQKRPFWKDAVWFAVGNLASISTFTAMNFTDTMRHFDNPNSFLAYAAITFLITEIYANITKTVLNESIQYSSFGKGIAGSTAGFLIPDVMTYFGLSPELNSYSMPMPYKVPVWLMWNGLTNMCLSVVPRLSIKNKT